MLEGNFCTENKRSGIAYYENARGVARENECTGNPMGIFVAETANPALIDNNCHDNSEEDVRDMR